MKAKKLFAVIVAVTLSMLMLTSCIDGGKRPTKLDAPKNVRVENAVLLWDAVANASGYLVSVNGGAKPASGSAFALDNLSEPGSYKLKVMAKGNGVAFADSDWSVERTYTVESAGATVNAQTFISAVNALPNAAEMTLADEAAVLAAGLLYAALTDEEKALPTVIAAYTVLTSRWLLIDAIKASQLSTAALAFLAAADAIATKGVITASDEAAINAALALYDLIADPVERSAASVTAAKIGLEAYKILVENLKATTLNFASASLETAEVGTAYAASVATALAPGDAAVVVPIAYRLKDGSSLPTGLSLSADGTIAGTAEKPVKRARFIVEATAAGYASAEAEFFIQILDAVTTVGAGGQNAVFEAEYVNLTGKQGSGWSGSAAGESMILGDSPNASNGYYLGWLNCPIEIDFEIFSDKPVTGATLIARLGGEFTGANFRAGQELDILINGVALGFAELKLSSDRSMNDFTLTASLSLAEGRNVIRLRVLENELWGGRCGGPLIDCIKIDNYGADATLSWRPYTYNVDHLK